MFSIATFLALREFSDIEFLLRVAIRGSHVSKCPCQKVHEVPSAHQSLFSFHGSYIFRRQISGPLDFDPFLERERERERERETSTIRILLLNC